MKEDFLHYVWQYKKFDVAKLLTEQGDVLTLIHSGDYLQKAGPDFFNAQIIIGNQKWAGNVEIHVKSSDWYLHHHETDVNYENVILHVVWEHDTPVFRKDNSEIPVLELKKHITKEVWQKYQSLTKPKTWIYCENQINSTDSFVFRNWKERLFFERLERKSTLIERLLAETENDWETVLFCMLAKNFGLNTNGEAFFAMAKAISYSVVRKECSNIQHLEALFFGQLDLFPVVPQDVFTKELTRSFDYLSQKYLLQKRIAAPVQFFKHRPDNFPTVRLAQLAMLYHNHQNLFSKISTTTKLEDFYALFDVGVSDYWQTHYQFDKESPRKKKRLSKSFINLVLINTIVPLQFTFAKSQGKEITESILALMETIPAEKNIVIDKFSHFGMKSNNAFETQSLLQLKNDYCSNGKCLQCGIGIQLLKE